MRPDDEPSSGRDNSDAPLESVVSDAIKQSEDGRVTLGVVLDAWGDRSYGPLFILLGFIGGTPLAVVPGAAAIVGLIIAVVAAQMAAGLSHPWLPQFVVKNSVSTDKLQSMRRKLEKPLRFIDRLITERLTFATNEAMRRAAAIFVTGLGLIMIPFDAVPFLVAAPAWAVVLFGVAILARDGLVMLLALAACLAIAFAAVSAF